MPFPPDIVPKLLIPFFQSGVMKRLVDTALEFGTGLNLFNKFRQMWPRDQSLPVDTYNQLIGWLTGFVGRAIKAGGYLSNLLSDQLIENSLIPRNFFLNRPGDTLCDTWVSAHYYTLDTETGSLFENVANIFIPAQTTKQGVLDAISARINQDLEAIAATNRRDKMYIIVPNSITIQASVRLC